MPQNSSYSVAFYTLGCRVNQYETRAVEEAFIAKGFTVGSFDEKCDVYVINTCTVTAESDRKSRQIIRRARKVGGNDALVLAMGCMVEVSPEQAAEIHGLDLAIGNRDKTALADAAVKLLAKRRGLSPEKFPSAATACASNYMHVTGSDKVRAFVKIADGCENHCSYCIIPKARGKVCSKPENEVCEEIAGLVRAGYKEVVLTGIETAAYGRDLPDSDLISLVEKVNSASDAPERIRMGSLEPPGTLRFSGTPYHHGRICQCFKGSGKILSPFPSFSSERLRRGACRHAPQIQYTHVFASFGHASCRYS